MKKIALKIFLIVFAFASLPDFKVKAQTAGIQLIHNSADPAADTLDVYFNGFLAWDDFAFRTATPFFDLPSGIPLEVGFAPRNSATVNDTLKSFTITLTTNDRYVVFACGVLNPANFAPNPDGSSTAFTLFIQNNIRPAALNAGDVDFIAFHGSTDAPSVDLLVRNSGIAVDNASYGTISSYISLTANDYILDVTSDTNNSIIYASYNAPLSVFMDSSMVLFGSGFFIPANNQNGPLVGFYAALGDGSVIELPFISLAGLQFIHNVADPAADSVDVYIDGTLTLDNFAFQTATPYLDIPADAIINIGIAGKSSTSVNDTLVNVEVSLVNGQNYLAVLNGVLTPANFAVNPNAINTSLGLSITGNMRLVSQISGNTEFVSVHGSTDAPVIDIVSRNSSTLADNILYTNISPYSSIPAANYYVDVTDAGQNTILFTYAVDLTGLTDSTAVLFTSGFIDPAANQNGAGFGLFAALANGSVVEFPVTSIAFLQAIHNCADPAADSLDIYALGFLAVDNFKFRTATEFLAVPAGIPLDVGVALGNSTSINDTIKNLPFLFENGKNYIVFASGVITPANFAVNPDGKNIAFNMLIIDYARLSASSPNNVDYITLHGSTDAPTIDIVISGGGPVLIDNSGYGDITPYLSTTATSYNIDVTPGNNNTAIIRSYIADFSALSGQSAVFFSSGFLDPSANQNGAPFGLFGALKDGTVFPFPDQTGIVEMEDNAVFSMYPNPASDYVIVAFKNKTSLKQTLTISTMFGQTVAVYESGYESKSGKIETGKLAKGMYFITGFFGDKAVTRKLVIE